METNIQPSCILKVFPNTIDMVSEIKKKTNNDPIQILHKVMFNLVV